MEQIFNIQTLLGSLRRLWWLPIVTLVASIGISWEITRKMPRFYQASTLVLVEPQKIPSNYVKPIVTTPIETRIRTVQQQIYSRSRIEAVINDYNLYPEVRDQVPMEVLVARVTRSIRLQVSGTNTFKIWYEDKDPKTAAIVANAIAELYIKENVDARRREARGTTGFLGVQLEQRRKDLEAKEAELAAFNRLHLEELPAQRDVNFRMLDGLRVRHQVVSDDISKEKDRKIVLEGELASLPESGGSAGPSGFTQLDTLRQELVELRGRFTESHPDVGALKRQIAQLEADLAARPALDPNAAARPVASLREQQLRQQIADSELKLKDLTRETERIQRDIVTYELRVSNAPRNEQLLLAMKRDYDILQGAYQDLLRNMQQAEMAETLEQELQGEQFIVLDRAVPPGAPFKPQPTQIIMIGSALGMALGVLLALLMDLLLPRFRTEDELAAAYAIPVLASIPRIATARAGRWGFLRRKAVVGTGVAGGLALLAALLVLWRR